jgi:uncharacterized delta-60 repeat protein
MGGEARQHRGKRLVLALPAMVCVQAAIVAGAGAENTTESSTFGSDGIASQSLGTHYEETEISNLQPRADGGLVLQRGRQVEAYLADGAPDAAVQTRRVSQYRRVFPLADGKSLVLGTSGLTRLNPDGGVDTSFGGNGTIKPPFDPEAAAELPSGKLVLARADVTGIHTFFADAGIGLLNSDGSVDGGLGTKGVLTVSLPVVEENSYVPEIAITGDGGALVVGGGFLLELRADGTPNPGFGSHGLAGELPRLVGGHVLADGSVEAVGYASGSSGDELVVLRYTAAGAPDSAFGAAGARRFDLGGEAVARVASWAADGSVVVGGSVRVPGSCPSSDNCEEEPILAAFDPAGNLDPGFGTGGVLRLRTLAGEPDWYPGGGVTGLVRRPDGSIVAAGTAPPERTVAYLAFASPAGALLSGIGEEGIVRLRQPVPATQKVVGLVPLANGKLLAAGTTDVGIEDAPVLIRYTAGGSLDPSFGGGAGYVAAGRSGSAMGFATDGSGQVLMGSYGYPRSSLLRLSASDGAPVRSFGSEGAVLLPRRVRVAALGLARDGDAVVLGIHDVAGTAEPGVVLRYHPDGKPDPAFGHNGRLPLRLPGGRKVEGKALISGTRERILVGGMVGRRFAIACLLPDGRAAPRFGAGGWSLASAGGGAKSLTLSRAGSHVYLAGVAGSEEHLHLVLMRFGDDGRLDPAFGRHGRFTAPISKPAQPKAIVPTRNGVLVVLGGGPRPLITFDRDGRVRRDWPGPHPRFVSDVRAAVSRGELFLGWNGYSYATGSTVFHGRDVYYLSRRSLRSRP